ncbi:ABC transporter permease [bacterium]|nr:ABC transporter permease [bacterium]
MLNRLWKFRELLFTLVRRDLLVRYQSSVLGFLWSFARPLALVAIFGIAFSVILRFEGLPGGVGLGWHILVGILAWSYFSRCLMEGLGAILGHANLIKKVKLPLEVFPATTVIGNLINYLLGMMVIFPVILLAMTDREGYSWTQAPAQILLFLAVTLLLTALAFALALLVSALHVFYRDVESIVDVSLQAWFYATPIVYPLTLLYENGTFKHGRTLEILYWLNPMTPICAAYRRILLYRSCDLEIPDATLVLYLALSVLTILVTYLIGQAVFHHFSKYFADEI